MFLDNIKIPDDINTIIIYVDIVFLILIILGYNYVPSINSIFTKPLGIVYASIISISICLTVKGYQRIIRLSFERAHTHLQKGERKL